MYIAEYARQVGATPAAVQAYISRKPELFTGHLIEDPRSHRKELDAVAVEILDKKYRRYNIETAADLKVKELEERIDKLQDKIIRLQDKNAVLLDQATKHAALEARLENLKLLEDRSEEQAEQIKQLRSDNEALRADRDRTDEDIARMRSELQGEKEKAVEADKRASDAEERARVAEEKAEELKHRSFWGWVKVMVTGKEE